MSPTDLATLHDALAVCNDVEALAARAASVATRLPHGMLRTELEKLAGNLGWRPEPVLRELLDVVAPRGGYRAEGL